MRHEVGEHVRLVRQRPGRQPEAPLPQPVVGAAPRDGRRAALPFEVLTDRDGVVGDHGADDDETPLVDERTRGVDRRLHRAAWHALARPVHDLDRTVEHTRRVSVVEDERDGVEEVLLEAPFVGSGGNTKSNSTPTLIGSRAAATDISRPRTRHAGSWLHQPPAELAVLHEDPDVVGPEVRRAERRSTVHDDRLTGDETTEVTQEEHRGTGQLLGRARRLSGSTTYRATSARSSPRLRGVRIVPAATALTLMRGRPTRRPSSGGDTSPALATA